MTELLSDREKLVSMYEFTKYYLDENTPFDFQKYMKKFDDDVFYESFSKKEFEKIPKDTPEFSETVIEETKRKPESGDKK